MYWVLKLLYFSVCGKFVVSLMVWRGIKDVVQVPGNSVAMVTLWRVIGVWCPIPGIMNTL